MLLPRRLLPAPPQAVLRRPPQLLAARAAGLRPPPRPAHRDRRAGALPERQGTRSPARAARPGRAQGRPGFPVRLAGDAEILAVHPRADDLQFADLFGVSRPRHLGLLGSDPVSGVNDDDLKHSYERPTNRWVCGWAAEGKPCPFGPSPGGRCGGAFECTPRRKLERWYCSRPDPRGGPCAEGPLPDGKCNHPIPPCRPVRSLRARRGLLGFLGAALSLGVLLWLAGGKSSQVFQSPGDLTFKHGTVTSSCAACHELPSEGATDLFLAATLPHKKATQTRLCLECHDLGDHATSPHGVPAQMLREQTLSASALPHGAGPFLLAAAKNGLGVPREADGSLTCGTCHREHQGRQFDLSFLDNQRCQACHVRQFASLAQGHPEFRGYPYHKRT